MKGPLLGSRPSSHLRPHPYLAGLRPTVRRMEQEALGLEIMTKTDVWQNAPSCTICYAMRLPCVSQRARDELILKYVITACVHTQG
jgi:hypothetical protein